MSLTLLYQCLFVSDNGGDSARGASNYPLRGWKGSYWEGGLHGVGFVCGGALKVSKSNHFFSITAKIYYVH